MNTKLHCRACGHPVCTFEEAKTLVQHDYTYTDAEIAGESFVLQVWHPDCAKSDGKIDNLDDLDGAPFYYAAYKQTRRIPT